MARRRFLQRAGAGLAAAAIGMTAQRRASAADELNALVWCDHTDPALLGPFEEASGARINTKEFATTGEALAILEQSQPGEWDVLVVDTIDVVRMARAGHLAALQPGDYPWDDFFPELHEQKLHYLDDKLYGVPEKFGYHTVAYNAERVDPADMRKAGVLWNPAYAGRMAVYDYYTPLMQMVAIASGIVPPWITPENLPNIRTELLNLKKNISMVGDVAGVQNALVSGAADIIVGGGEFVVAGLNADNPNLQWVMPDEGGIRWIQSLAIFEASQKKELANQFINYMIGPEGQGRLATSACYWGMPANTKAVLSDAQRATLRWDEQPAFVARSWHYQMPDPDLDAAMLDVWTEFLQA